MFKAPRRVGVAPGTTTLVLGSTVPCSADMARGNPGAAVDLSWVNAPPAVEPSCIPVCVGPTAPTAPKLPTSTVSPAKPRSTALAPAPDYAAPRATRTTDSAATRLRALSPYATFEDLRGSLRQRFRRAFRTSNLGLVLNPFGPLAPSPSEIAMNRQDYGAGYCGPFDAQYNTRGEQGFYYDSPLGNPLGATIPTDMQMSRVVGYTPYMNGWVNFRERSWAGSWVPPDGTPGNNVVAWGPPVAGGGLGLGLGQEATSPSAVVVTSDEKTAESAVELLKKHQDRTFTLSVLSTLAVASTAALAWWRYHQEQQQVRKKNNGSQQQPQSPNPVLSGRRRRRR